MGWMSVKEALPPTPKSAFEMTQYLVQYADGRMSTVYWCDGFNCMLLTTGEVYRECEFTDVVAWMPLPEPYKESE